MMFMLDYVGKSGTSVCTIIIHSFVTIEFRLDRLVGKNQLTFYAKSFLFLICTHAFNKNIKQNSVDHLGIRITRTMVSYKTTLWVSLKET